MPPWLNWIEFSTSNRRVSGSIPDGGDKNSNYTVLLLASIV